MPEYANQSQNIFLCSLVSTLLPRYNNGELDEENQQFVEVHLDSCKECYAKCLDSLLNSIKYGEEQKPFSLNLEMREKINQKDPFVSYWQRVIVITKRVFEIAVKCKKNFLPIPKFCLDFMAGDMPENLFLEYSQAFLCKLQLVEFTGNNIFPHDPDFKKSEEFWRKRREKVNHLIKFCQIKGIEYPLFLIKYVIGFVTENEYKILMKKFIKDNP